MPRSTGFPGIETGYADLATVPANNESMWTVNGTDYNVTFNQAFEIAVARGLGAPLAAALAAQLDDYIVGAPSGGSGFALLDEDDFASNSAIAAPSQQSTKAYVDGLTGTGAVTNARLANMAQSTIKGRITASTGAPEDLSAAQVRTLLNVGDGAEANPSDADIVTAVNSVGGVALASVDDLDGATAGALYETALIASVPLTAAQSIKTNAGNTAFEAWTPGTAATLDVMPSGAPTSVSSTAGAITLDFDGVDELQTNTTEAITAITFSNIAPYASVVWYVTHTTARNITFPAGTKIAGNSGALLVVGIANSDMAFVIRNKNGTYHVRVSDEAVTGA